MAKQDDIPKGYTILPDGTMKYPTDEKIDKTEVKIEGFDLLPQVAIQLARFSLEDPIVQKDKGLFGLCIKSRKYINLMLDKAIDNMGTLDVGWADVNSMDTLGETIYCDICGYKHLPGMACPVKDV